MSLYELKALVAAFGRNTGSVVDDVDRDQASAYRFIRDHGASLLSEVEALRADARRYRWLRDRSNLVDDSDFWIDSVGAWKYMPGGQPNVMHESLDAAIDAMQEGKPHE